MLDVLPTDVSLNVLSLLPIPLLLPLSVLSRQWFRFFTAHQSAIFHGAAIHHEYIQPGTSLEDALSMNTGRPWAGSTSWKDFCYRSFQFRKNWEGKGRAVARQVMPPDCTARHIKVDEKAGICIATHFVGGLTVTHLFSGITLWCLPRSYISFSSDCEYDNGYLVFDNKDDGKEVWRLASDFPAEDEVAVDAPPNNVQMAASASAAAMYHQYAPRGQFRPWALLRLPSFTMYRLVYPTLMFACHEQASLYDVRTGSLIQTIDLNLLTLSYVDVSERHVFVCEKYVVHVFSRESDIEVLHIPAWPCPIVRCSQRVEAPFLVSGDRSITPLSVSPNVEESPRLKFIAVHVSRDGRDLMVLSKKCRVVFIQDFERICRGETTFVQAGLVLGIQPEAKCYSFSFEHGRVSVATVHGFYILTLGPDLSAKAVLVRPSNNTSNRVTPCMQLTDRRLYFPWVESRRRQDLTLFEDVENAQEVPPSITSFDDALEYQEPVIYKRWIRQSFLQGQPGYSVGCIDFTLMPEGYASEI